jgi:hypothetical protein
MNRKCRSCLEEKDESKFYKYNLKHDKNPICKECVRKYQNDYYCRKKLGLIAKEYLNPYTNNNQIWCDCCNIAKDKTQFLKSDINISLFVCKECKAIIKRDQINNLILDHFDES